MAETRAQANRRIRQEALREQLSQQKHLEQYIDTYTKIQELDVCSDKFNNELSKLKTANEQRLKIIDKYLPSEKYMELAGDPENPIHLDNKWTIEVVSAESKDTKEA